MNKIHENIVVSSLPSDVFSGSSEPSSYSTQDFRPLRLNSSSDLENIQVGKILEVRKNLKYSLQRVAKQILKPDKPLFVTLPGATSPIVIKDKWHRFRACYRTPISKEVDIVYSESSKKAHISNVSTCSNVHSCPVCSSYIAAERCEEIKLAMSNHFKAFPGGSVLMMVLTNSHDREDVLEISLDKRKEAKAIFDAERVVKETIKSVGVYGKINSFEITVSKLNGWHPHNHILLFCEQKMDESSICILENKLSVYYRKSLQAVGLSGSDERALKIYGGEYASQYVTKLAEEITLKNSKLGNITSNIPHYTPFQLLDYIHLNHDNDSVSVSWAVDAFYEYAETMRGRKSIVWSRGLKKLLGVNEVSDDEAAQPPEKDLMVYYSIPSSDWIRINRENIDYRPLILSAAEQGREFLYNYLRSLGVQVVDRGIFPLIRKPPILEQIKYSDRMKMKFKTAKRIILENKKKDSNKLKGVFEEEQPKL